MQRNITITDEQMAYIFENKNKRTTSEIAKDLGISKGKVHNNYTVATMKKAEVKEGIFNIKERENWII